MLLDFCTPLSVLLWFQYIETLLSVMQNFTQI